MPSTSAKQARFMAAAAHNPSFAKKAGISQGVAREFNQADKGRKFSEGGSTDDAEDKRLVAQGVHKHERNMHKGEKLTKVFKAGGSPAESGRHGKVKEALGGEDLGLPGGKHGRPKEALGGKDVTYAGGGDVKYRPGGSKDDDAQVSVKDPARHGKAKESGGGKDVGYRAGGAIRKFAKGGVPHHHQIEKKHSAGYRHNDMAAKKLGGGGGFKMDEHYTKKTMGHDHALPDGKGIKKFAKGGLTGIKPKGLGLSGKSLGHGAPNLMGRMGPDIMERQAVRGAGTAMPADMPGSRLYNTGGKVKIDATQWHNAGTAHKPAMKIGWKSGGHVKTGGAHRRADGLARKGHTRGKFV